MGYLSKTRDWLFGRLDPLVEDKSELDQVIEEIAEEILDSYKNGIQAGKSDSGRSNTKETRRRHGR